MNRKKQTVLVGITGGVASTVAAYLLKKQNWNVIGLGVLLGSRKKIMIDDFIASKDSQDLPSDLIESELKDIEKAAKVCQELDIPFYASDASSEYRDYIYDYLLASRLAGRRCPVHVLSHRLVVETLQKKANILEANFVSTGHFAKLQTVHEKTEKVIAVSNDGEFDQSFLLSRLPQRLIQNLILPLSDMKMGDVKKIGETLGDFIVDSPTVKNVIDHPRLSRVVDHSIPQDLKKPGEVIDHIEDRMICEHEGHHLFYPGSKDYELKSGVNVDSEMEVIRIDDASGDIFLARSSKLFYNHLSVTDFRPSFSYDVSKPLEIFVQYHKNSKKIPCKVYFKSNGSLSLEFAEVRPGLIYPGQFIALYNRATHGGRLLGCATVSFSYLKNAELITRYPKSSREQQYGEFELTCEMGF